MSVLEDKQHHIGLAECPGVSMFDFNDPSEECFFFFFVMNIFDDLDDIWN